VADILHSASRGLWTNVAKGGAAEALVPLTDPHRGRVNVRCERLAIPEVVLIEPGIARRGAQAIIRGGRTDCPMCTGAAQTAVTCRMSDGE